MANVKANTQNTQLRTPMASAWNVNCTKLSLGTGGTGATTVSPRGGRPRSCGRSRASHMNSSQLSRAPRLGIISATRQPHRSVAQAASGMKIRVPVAMAPLNRPITKPRRATNQRDATTADSCIAVRPGAMPSRMPMPSHNCHFSVVAAAIARPTISSAPDSITMRLGP